MRFSASDKKNLFGFTIVELIVVIVIIGILAALSAVGYGNWQKTILETQLKSDLNGVAVAMENARIFENAYPSGIPSTFTPSKDVTLSGGSENGKSYCVDATSADNSVKYHIDSMIYKEGAKIGSCSESVYDSYPVGASISGYWSTAPDGFLLEDGSTLQILDYPDLYAVIGANYGGDGSTNFRLPDSRGRATVNKGTDSLFDTIGELSGVKSVALTVAQMPSHNHGLTQNYGYAVGGTGVTNGWTEGSFSSHTALAGGNQAHNNIQPSIVKQYAIKYKKPVEAESALEAATSLEGYWSTAPEGYLYEDGSAISRTTYASLFSILGTTYGSGDGSTTFNLPDSRGRVAVNKNASDSEFDIIGKKFGTTTETISIDQMPAHSHGLSQTFGYEDGETSATVGWNGSTSYNIESVGGGEPHTNVQPSIVKMVVIKYTEPTEVNTSLAPGTSISGYWSTAPDGFLLEDGSSLQISDYPDLFAAIGNNYGGDGRTYFCLPNSKGRVSVNLNSNDSEFMTLGKISGVKTVTLTTQQLPIHSHHITQAYYGTGSVAAANIAWNGTSAYSTSPTGGNQPHNNIQPSIVKMFAIKY